MPNETYTVEDVVGWMADSGVADQAIAAYIKSYPGRGTLKSTVRALSGAFDIERLEMEVALNTAAGTQSNPFGRGNRRANNLPPSRRVEPWNFGLYPGKVHFFIGESGAGKSTLLYYLMLAAASQRAFMQYAFQTDRPLNVYYVDPENAGNFDDGDGGLCAEKIERIGLGFPSTIEFNDGRDVDLSSKVHMAALTDKLIADRTDIVVLDPLANLFGMSNENDNAEAGKIMKSVVTLARVTGACVVLVHHTGKSDSGLYRGASAFLGACDVATVLRSKGDEDEADDTFDGTLRQRSDLVRWQMVKNRLSGKASIYLRMAGADRFELASFDEWKAANQKESARGSGLQQATMEIPLLLADGAWYSRARIEAELAAEGLAVSAITSAIRNLEATGVITARKMKSGRANEYALTATATPEDVIPVSAQIAMDEEALEVGMLA